MRIVLTCDAVGGVWQYSVDLARALGADGIDVVLAVMGPSPSRDQRLEANSIAHVRLVETGLPLDWLCDGPGAVLAAGARIAELADDICADLLQLNMPTLGAAALPRIPVVAVTHGCVSTWWQAARPHDALDPAFRWHRALMGEGLRAADRVVAPTAAYARVVAHHYGLRSCPQVVHNGRAPLGPVSHPAAHDSVLTVGRLWDPVKGAALLDRVAARLAVPFHAAGAAEGPHGERVDCANLHLLGQLDRAGLAAQLAQRPVFVSAARFEPFGLAVLEAAAAGCALVLADIPGFRELWGGVAQFVPPDDEDGFVAAIEAVIGDLPARAAMGEAARVRADRYRPEATASAMRTVYADALSACPRRGRKAA